MKIDIDWRGMFRACFTAITKAMLPFLTGALTGILAGCSINGSGIGLTC